VPTLKELRGTGLFVEGIPAAVAVLTEITKPMPRSFEANARGMGLFLLMENQLLSRYRLRAKEGEVHIIMV